MDQRNICSYADIVDKSVDLRVLELKAIFLKLRSLFRFRDDILISAWERNSRKAKINTFFTTLNSCDQNLQHIKDVVESL